MIKIAAVICTYNRYDVLIKAINSLISQTLPDSEYEILIIDNTPGSKNGEGAVVSKKYETVCNLKYIFEKISGLSNARNVAINATDAKYIAYLDDDAIADSNWLKQIINGFESFETVGVVGGQIRPIWDGDLRPIWLSNSLLGYVTIVDWGGSLRIASDEEWLAGANISFRRKLLLDCGAFSTNLGRTSNADVLLSNEEVEIIDLIKRAGYVSVYNPKAVVDHLVERKRLEQSWFRRRVAWQATSDYLIKTDKINIKMKEKIKNVKAYLSSLPPLQRNIQGLYYETDDPNIFEWQLSAIYGFTCLTLAGYEGIEDE